MYSIYRPKYVIYKVTDTKIYTKIYINYIYGNSGVKEKSLMIFLKNNIKNHF